MPLNPMAETDPKGIVIAYCPFPECDGDMDELGHCRHFIGHSNDGVLYEPTLPLIRKFRDGTSYDTGFKSTGPGKETPNRLNKQEPIPEGAVKVNPQVKQVVDGIESLAYKWHSWRLYKRDANYVPSVSHPMPGDPPTAPMNQNVTSQESLAAQLELERAKQRTLELELQLRKKEKRTSKGRHKRMPKPQPEPIGAD